MTIRQSIMSFVAYAEIARFPGYRFGDDGSVWSRHSCGGGVKRGTSVKRPKEFRKEWHRLRTATGYGGHLAVKLRCCDRAVNCLVHRLILEAFKGPCPEGLECCHNDGDAGNNRLENLRWDTRESNLADKARHHKERRLGLPTSTKRD